ncbi:creatininase family protein [Amycolatopsis dendrobii]|uniref:Creatininase family protein n=1 Tax=Amycolatopsis dendrobii TaxID=2760662 RepID=A0A7W3VUH7_9PSEU|nr:creatininase family protein [Amycolatopsis dendrobii]MBB1153082.1 creatininase family protein [Amycolatopsis dendrobii]
MGALLRWAEADRAVVRGVLSEALVLVPIGATEQHGPHLPTGTDAFLAAAVCERAAELAAPRAERALLLAPAIPYGASDHHLPFNGTLSLSAQTLLHVLDDLARSIAVQGGRRMVVVNGHGGNVGICHAFAGAASTRHGLAVAHTDYWRVLGPEDIVPGHAGEFETSMMLAVRGELVQEPAKREQPRQTGVSDVDIHSEQVWLDIDGYTDRPELAAAEQGSRWFEKISSGLADRFVKLAEVL